MLRLLLLVPMLALVACAHNAQPAATEASPSTAAATSPMTRQHSDELRAAGLDHLERGNYAEAVSLFTEAAKAPDAQADVAQLLGIATDLRNGAGAQ